MSWMTSNIRILTDWFCMVGIREGSKIGGRSSKRREGHRCEYSLFNKEELDNRGTHELLFSTNNRISEPRRREHLLMYLR